MRYQPRYRAKAAKSSAHLAAALHNDDSGIQPALPAISAQHASIDGLRFKLKTRGERHYFSEVRFGDGDARTPEMQAVVKMLSRKCLEDLTREYISEVLGDSPHLREVQNLISELQAVLCE